MNQLPNQCQYGVPWVGRCKELGQKDDHGLIMCEKHANRVCCGCGKPATHGCDHTGIQFVCGYDLCDGCEHGPLLPGDRSVFMLGGGHWPHYQAQRIKIEFDAKWREFLKEEFPEEYEKAMACELPSQDVLQKRDTGLTVEQLAAMVAAKRQKVESQDDSSC